MDKFKKVIFWFWMILTIVVALFIDLNVKNFVDSDKDVGIALGTFTFLLLTWLIYVGFKKLKKSNEK